MSLDITAYRQIKAIDCVFDEDGEPIDPTTREEIDYDFRAYINSDFPGRADDVRGGAIYSSQDSTGFRIGYGGYNHWRNELARIAGFPETDFERYGSVEKRHDAGAWAATEGPFWELILFSDCEGVIGSAVAKKLAADFVQYQEQADKEDEHFRNWYATWREAFDMAADGGAVSFH